MTKINTIQTLIDLRADDKLQNDLRALQRSIYTGIYYELIKDIVINIGTTEKPKFIPLYLIFCSEGFQNEIIEKNTERYRGIESKEFISKFDKIVK